LYGTKIVVSISFYTFNVSIALDDYSNIAILLLLFSAFAAFASSSSLIYSGVFSSFSSSFAWDDSLDFSNLLFLAFASSSSSFLIYS